MVKKKAVLFTKIFQRRTFQTCNFNCDIFAHGYHTVMPNLEWNDLLKDTRLFVIRIFVHYPSKLLLSTKNYNSELIKVHTILIIKSTILEVLLSSQLTTTLLVAPPLVYRRKKLLIKPKTTLLVQIELNSMQLYSCSISWLTVTSVLLIHILLATLTIIAQSKTGQTASQTTKLGIN